MEIISKVAWTELIFKALYKHFLNEGAKYLKTKKRKYSAGQTAVAKGKAVNTFYNKERKEAKNKPLEEFNGRAASVPGADQS